MGCDLNEATHTAGGGVRGPFFSLFSPPHTVCLYSPVGYDQDPRLATHHSQRPGRLLIKNTSRPRGGGGGGSAQVGRHRSGQNT